MDTSPHPGAELRALVVDDDVDAATSLSYLLQLLGCRTAVAFGGFVGLRVAQLFQPTLAFLDLEMPGEDGCQVLQMLRLQDAGSRYTYCVCLTGASDPNDEQRCLAAGFDRFVTKPMEPSILSDILDSCRNGGPALRDEIARGGRA